MIYFNQPKSMAAVVNTYLSLSLAVRCGAVWCDAVLCKLAS